MDLWMGGRKISVLLVHFRNQMVCQCEAIKGIYCILTEFMYFKVMYVVFLVVLFYSGTLIKSLNGEKKSCLKFFIVLEKGSGDS